MNPAPHVFTLTANPLAERTLEFESWSPGRTQRASHETFQTGGKGINVSRMLTRLQHPNTALTFCGGATGDACVAWLQQSKISFHAFPTGTPTRSGAVIRDRSGTHPETTFLGPDAAPDANAVAACAEYLDTRPDGQVLALCGSVPGWSTSAFAPLRKALDRWLERGVLVVDTYGPPLAWAASRQLALIKINADEYRTLPSATDGAPTGPVERWIITDGPGPICFLERGGKVDTATPPAIQEVSPTGSGDVLLAAVIHALYACGRSLEDAVRYAIPYATANAAHPGVAEFPLP